MNHWTLRTRLTLWSAVFFATAVALLGAITISLVRQHQVESLDAELLSESRSFFHELAEHGPSGVMHAVAELDKAARCVVIGADGSLLWASPELGTERFEHVAPGVQTAGVWRVRSAIENGYTVRLARGFEGVEATVADVRRAYLLSLPMLLTFVGGGAWLLVRSALRPVQAIGEAAQRITTEHLDERLPEPTRRDELGQLTSVLNQMLDRLDRGFHQAVRFTADASHELRTPLSLIAAGIEQLLRRRDLPPEVIAELGSLLEDNRRLAAVCHDLLLLARADAGRFTLECQPHDLCALIEAAVEDARILAEGREIHFAVELPATAHDSVDGRFFTRIVLNLLSNAVKYSRPGGIVRVRLVGEEKSWVLDIENNGPEIPAEHQDRIFERFFRIDNSAATPGHGLGLSLSREIARAHRGDLTLVRSDSQWTTFRFSFARTAQRPEATPTSAPAEAALHL